MESFLSGHVFVSHASADADTASAICRALEQRGVACWIAPRDIPPGVPFLEAIVGAIHNCEAFLVVVSQNANESLYVSSEVKTAWEARRRILPYRLADVRLSSELDFYTSRHQWVDARGRDAEEMADSLVAALGFSAAPPTVRENPAEAARSVPHSLPHSLPHGLPHGGPPRTGPRRGLLPWGLAAIAVVGLGAIAYFALRGDPAPAPLDVVPVVKGRDTGPVLAAADAGDWQEVSRLAANWSADERAALPRLVREGWAAFLREPGLRVLAPTPGELLETPTTTLRGEVAAFRADDRLIVQVQGRPVFDEVLTKAHFEVPVQLPQLGDVALDVLVRWRSEERARVHVDVSRVHECPPWCKKHEAAQAAAARAAALPIGFENELGMRFVLVPPGRAEIGAEEGDLLAQPDEVRRRVEFRKPFFMQVGEVSNAAYAAFHAAHRSGNVGAIPLDDPAQPVVRVAFPEAQRFAAWLSQTHPAYAYRLPTEAEWEYAARAAGGFSGAAVLANQGLARFVNFGDRSAAVAFAAWRIEAALDDRAVGPLPRDGREPNPLGLRHMLGNVAEWVADWYDTPQPGDVLAPQGPLDGTLKVVRGGSWGSEASETRLSSRFWWPPRMGDPFIGFRLVAEPTR